MLSKSRPPPPIGMGLFAAAATVRGMGSLVGRRMVPTNKGAAAGFPRPCAGVGAEGSGVGGAVPELLPARQQHGRW